MTNFRVAALAAMLFVVGTMARNLEEIEQLQELRRGYSSYSYKPTRTVTTRTYHSGGYSGGYYNGGYSSYGGGYYSSYNGGGGGVYYGGGGFGCIFCIVLCILCCRGNNQDQNDGGYVTETVVVESYDVQQPQPMGYGGQTTTVVVE